MSNVKRVYVEKKPEFAVTAKGLGHEIRHYLGIKDVTGVRVLIRMWRSVCRASGRYPLQRKFYKE